jgi:Common central domain of tyrosinase
MELSRREMVRLMGMSAAASAVLRGSPLVAKPTVMPLPRMPLEEFVQDAQLLAALRKGVRAMKQRKPSDPLSWFYQAAIHGVTPEAIAKAVAQDPKVDDVFKKRYWNQCPHDGENSANFLPWHRGYTHYFEKILRMHTEDDRFSLPYWNYKKKENRKFPKEFGIQHLDGNLTNNKEENINPLYLAERDFYFTGYEHPFAQGLPLLELTDSAVDDSLSMNSPVFFGETEREGLGGGIADEDPSTRGLLESYPHDHIHRSVGGIIDSSSGAPTVGAMATPPTAGFDPIFSIHHSNIDRLWAEWSCMAGKKWGKLPSEYWFNERPWFFFDVDGKVINEPRRAYFDYRALGIRFKYEDLKCTPLALPNMISFSAEAALPELQPLTLLEVSPVSVNVLTAGRAVVPLAPAMKKHFQAARTDLKVKAAMGGGRRLLLRLQGVDLGLVQATGFDLHLTANAGRELRRTDESFIGSIGLFRHLHGGDAGDPHARMGRTEMDETFDVSKATAAIGAANLEGLSLIAVPYALLTAPAQNAIPFNREFLKIGGLQLLSTP